MNPLNETADLTATLAKNDIADLLLKLTYVQSCDSCRLWHRFKYTGEDGEPTVRRTIKVVFYVLHLADNFHVLRHFRCYLLVNMYGFYLIESLLNVQHLSLLYVHAVSTVDAYVTHDYVAY